MKVYVTRSKKLTVTIKVDGIKKDIRFDRGVRNEGLMAAIIKDEEECKALESTSIFNAEFWFYEDRPDHQPAVKAKSGRKVYYKDGVEPENTVEPEHVVEPVDEVTGEETPSETGPKDYPEIKSAQKAKLLLVNDLEIATLAECTNAAAIRQIAKSHNITFSNWKE